MASNIDDDIEREIVLLIPPLRRYTITVKILSNSTVTIDPPPPPINETWMERAQRELLATVEGDGNQYMMCHTLDGKSELVMTRRGNEEYHG